MYLFSNDETKVICTIKKMLELSKNDYIENIVGFEELEAIERLLDLFLELERVHEASHEGIIEVIKENQELRTALIRDYISKDNIKAKIERYQRTIDDSNDGDLIHDLMKEIDVLERLLKEE